MNMENTITQLEKLNELKEKGVLTQEEFNSKKQELLNNDCEVSLVKNAKTSGVNIVYSIVFTLFAMYGIAVLCVGQGINTWIPIISSAFIYSIIAAKLKTKEYNAWYCQPVLGVFIGVTILWLGAFPIYTYAFVQIKDKNVPLREKSK